MTLNEASPVGSANATPRGSSVGTFIRDVVVILLVAILISFVLKTFVVRSFYIPSGSMEPTLMIDDRVIVNQLLHGLVPIERGDVVVFEDPGGWLPPSPEGDSTPLERIVSGALAFVGLIPADTNNHLVKRVIGLPGDTVVCCNELDQVTLNGLPLDEPYIQFAPGASAPARVEFDVTVPTDSLWVMGDNRNNSRDSRYNMTGPGGGTVAYSSVVGRAIVISWPIDRWSWLDNFENTFAGVDDPL
ncbi:signal peptidase I [Marisediminicola sp. LYQ134]|uniref:signal peptidase I n=1 Tax=Marisediminicola sp. LYQ134 TaxID=3391061 RepID=UPI0039832640